MTIASSNQMKDAIEAALKKAGYVDDAGNVDYEKISKVDEDEFRKQMNDGSRDNINALITDPKTKDINTTDFINRISDIADQIKKNSDRYARTKQQGAFEESVTGTDPSKGSTFSPYAGVDFSKPSKFAGGTIVVAGEDPNSESQDQPDSGGESQDQPDGGSQGNPDSGGSGGQDDPNSEEPTADPDYDVDDEFDDTDVDENFRDYPNEATGTPQTTTTPTPSADDKPPERIDNSKAFASVKDTNTIFSAWHMAYGVAVGGIGNYQNYQAALTAHLARLIRKRVNEDADEDRSDKDFDSGKSNERATAEKHVKDAIDSVKEEDNINAERIDGQRFMYMSPSVSDASIGGNDAINPYSAFNVDDDLVHDISYSKGKEYSWGMGRCYAEMYESKQYVVYLTMGLPKYRNLQEWLTNATNKEMSEMNDLGEQPSGFKLGQLIVNGVKLAIALPWLPIKWAVNIINGVKDFKVTEYFYFRDTMPLFYRYCNSFLSEAAVGMGLYWNGEITEKPVNDGTTGEQQNGQSSVQAGKNNVSTGSNPANGGANMDSSQAEKMSIDMPEILKDGPDIFKIMCKRAQRASAGNMTYSTTDDMIENAEAHYNDMNQKDADPTLWKTAATGLSNFWSGIKAGALEGMNFIGFRIEKMDTGESFSNSTQDSPLLAALNEQVAANRKKYLDEIGQGQGAMAGMLSGARNLATSVSNIKQAASNIVSAMKGNNSALNSVIAYAASGNGYFDLPKQWSGSSGMTRSLSFSLKLRAKTGGDNVSIFQSIMVPLSILISAALPRAVGDSSYTSPFLVRAFCKGMFSIPAGIITTLSITRGASEFGWSLNRIPTVVDVNFTIDDLSPMLFLSVAGGKGAWDALKQAFVNNSKMHEYINTLVGIGLKERYYLMGQLKRRLKTAALISKNTLFSATYHGYVMGDSAIVRSLMALTPHTWVPSERRTGR